MSFLPVLLLAEERVEALVLCLELGDVLAIAGRPDDLRVHDRRDDDQEHQRDDENAKRAEHFLQPPSHVRAVRAPAYGASRLTPRRLLGVRGSKIDASCFAFVES